MSFLHFRGRTFVGLLEQTIASSNYGAYVDVWDFIINPHVYHDPLSHGEVGGCTVGSFFSSVVIVFHQKKIVFGFSLMLATIT